MKNRPVKTGRPRNTNYEGLSRTVAHAIMMRTKGSELFDMERSDIQGLRVSTSLHELKKEFHGYKIVLRAGLKGGVFVEWSPREGL